MEVLVWATVSYSFIAWLLVTNSNEIYT